MFEISMLVWLLFPYFARSQPAPQLNWRFDHESSDGYINETNSETKNRAFLLPGTDILATNTSGRSAYFNGTNSGMIFENITSSCFAEPWTCQNGLSVAFWIKIYPSINETNSGMILASANVNILQISNGTIIVTLWNGTMEWKVSHQRNISQSAWQCFTIVWNTKTLSLFINDVKMAANSNVSSTMTEYALRGKAVSRRLVLGNRASDTIDHDTIRMSIGNLIIWNNTVYKICREYSSGGAGQQSYIKTKYVSQIFTSIEYKNKAIVGHVFKSYQVANLTECINQCKENKDSCQSFNYEAMSSNVIFICELNTIGMAVNRVEVEYRKNFQLYDVYWSDERL